MQADPELGETPGGLHSPFVLVAGGRYHMLDGDWEHICLATSDDGKSFARHRGPGKCPALFSEGAGANTRDPMVLRISGLYHCYYTAYPNRRGAVYCRTSPDLKTWSDSRRVAFGGSAGTGPYAAECPFVVHREREGCYYLFRTQRYGAEAQTTVYRSEDPLDFGLESDDYRISAAGRARVRHLKGGLPGLPPPT
jgi:sucrose-6-phosphate hydrolase SacC (GH32 family)